MQKGLPEGVFHEVLGEAPLAEVEECLQKLRDETSAAAAELAAIMLEPDGDSDDEFVQSFGKVSD